MSRVCGKRNLDPMPEGVSLADGSWLATDWLCMCYLPYEHKGRCHWRIPKGYSCADPNVEEYRRINEAVERVGHLGADAVDELLGAAA